MRFDDARQLVSYFAELGIGAVYLSPFFRARQGSTHGYDVVDHGNSNRGWATKTISARLAETLRGQGLGLLVDIVPNHMGIDDPHNAWWQDVLENGQARRSPRYFDIDWNPPKEALRGQVLLPVLGDQYGKVLEDQQLSLAYEDTAAGDLLLRAAVSDRPAQLGAGAEAVVELVATALAAEVRSAWSWKASSRRWITCRRGWTSKARRVQSSVIARCEVARRRLSTLLEASSEVREALDQHDRRIQRPQG